MRYRLSCWTQLELLLLLLSDAGSNTLVRMRVLGARTNVVVKGECNNAARDEFLIGRMILQPER